MSMARGMRLVLSAVTAGLVAVALLGAAGGARAGTGGSAAGALSGVPKFYVALPDGDNFANVPGDTKAQVRDTFSGKLLLTLRPAGKDRFVSVSAAADDRTFVLGANPNLSPPAVPMATDWYLVHLVPGARFHATMRKLRVPVPASDELIDATALSPDGSEVALLGIVDRPQPIGRPPASADFLRVYSVATGKLLRSWSTTVSEPFGAYVTLFWTGGGRGLAFGYNFAAGKQGYLGVRTLSVGRPGRNLMADSRLAWSVAVYDTVPTTYPFTCAYDLRVVVTPDGRKVVCAGTSVFRAVNLKPGSATCPAIPPWEATGFLAYSTATGKLAGTIYKRTSNCQFWNIDVLWTSATGDKLVGFVAYGSLFPGATVTIRFGVYGAGKFSKLPVPPTTTTVPNAIAW